MTVQKLIDLLNLIPDKNLIVEVECWGEGSVPATDIYITTHDEPQHHVDDNGNPIEFTDYVLIDGQWGTKGDGLHIATDYAEKYPNACLKSKSYSHVDASVNDVLENVRNYMKFIVNKARHEHKYMTFASVDKLIDLTIDGYKREVEE